MEKKLCIGCDRELTSEDHIDATGNGLCHPCWLAETNDQVEEIDELLHD